MHLIHEYSKTSFISTMPNTLFTFMEQCLEQKFTFTLFDSNTMGNYYCQVRLNRPANDTFC